MGELSTVLPGFGNSEESRHGVHVVFVSPGGRYMPARMVRRTSSRAQNIKFKVDWSMNRNWSQTDQATNAVLVHVIGSGMQLYKWPNSYAILSACSTSSPSS